MLYINFCLFKASKRLIIQYTFPMGWWLMSRYYVCRHEGCCMSSKWQGIYYIQECATPMEVLIRSPKKHRKGSFMWVFPCRAIHQCSLSIGTPGHKGMYVHIIWQPGVHGRQYYQYAYKHWVGAFMWVFPHHCTQLPGQEPQGHVHIWTK